MWTVYLHTCSTVDAERMCAHMPCCGSARPTQDALARLVEPSVQHQNLMMYIRSSSHWHADQTGPHVHDSNPGDVRGQMSPPMAEHKATATT